MSAVRKLRTIDASTCKQACEVGNTYAKNLLGQDVVDTLLEVWDSCRQPLCEAARDLSKEYSGLRNGIKEGNSLVRPDICAIIFSGPSLSEGVKHPIGELRRSEDLVN